MLVKALERERGGGGGFRVKQNKGWEHTSL